jgi:hypothetical protein
MGLARPWAGTLLGLDFSGDRGPEQFTMLPEGRYAPPVHIESS